ncbi:MAG: hypothetical protein VKN13_05085 [Cyanobacteriota bacterium]|nr:hypothetical protein [Cyanobacteriota bacterium]
MEGISKDNSRGIEIGPWTNPVAPRSQGWQTLIVDYTDAESLRDNARKHAGTVHQDMIDNIEEVDIVWQGGSLRELLLSKDIGNLDYFVSSHNIEHSVDIVDHLQAAEVALAQRGVMSLAVPDMRYTFDLLRSPTTVADALRVHRYGLRVHEPEYFLDQQLNSILNQGHPCWTTRTSLQEITLTVDPLSTWNEYSRMLGESDYQDCHRWCFVPASFELLLYDLRWMGLVNLRITSMRSAETGILGSEFLVQLKKAKNFQDKAPPSSERIKKKRLALQFKVMQQLADRLRIPYHQYVESVDQKNKA